MKKYLIVLSIIPLMLGNSIYASDNDNSLLSSIDFDFDNTEDNTLDGNKDEQDNIGQNVKDSTNSSVNSNIYDISNSNINNSLNNGESIISNKENEEEIEDSNIQQENNKQEDLLKDNLSTIKELQSEKNISGNSLLNESSKQQINKSTPLLNSNEFKNENTNYLSKSLPTGEELEEWNRSQRQLIDEYKDEQQAKNTSSLEENIGNSKQQQGKNVSNIMENIEQKGSIVQPLQSIKSIGDSIYREENIDNSKYQQKEDASNVNIIPNIKQEENQQINNISEMDNVIPLENINTEKQQLVNNESNINNIDKEEQNQQEIDFENGFDIEDIPESEEIKLTPNQLKKTLKANQEGNLSNDNLKEILQEEDKQNIANIGKGLNATFGENSYTNAENTKNNLNVTFGNKENLNNTGAFNPYDSNIVPNESSTENILEKLDKKVDEIKDDVNSIKEKQGTTDKKVTAIGKRIDSIQKTVDDHQKVIDQITKKQKKENYVDFLVNKLTEADTPEKKIEVINKYPQLQKVEGLREAIERGEKIDPKKLKNSLMAQKNVKSQPISNDDYDISDLFTDNNLEKSITDNKNVLDNTNINVPNKNKYNDWIKTVAKGGYIDINDSDNSHNNVIKNTSRNKKYINKVLDDVKNAKANSEKIKLAESYPEIKESIQKSIAENKPIDIGEVEQKLIQSNQQAINNEQTKQELMQKLATSQKYYDKDTGNPSPFFIKDSTISQKYSSNGIDLNSSLNRDSTNFGNEIIPNSSQIKDSILSQNSFVDDEIDLNPPITESQYNLDNESGKSTIAQNKEPFNIKSIRNELNNDQQVMARELQQAKNIGDINKLAQKYPEVDNIVKQYRQEYPHKPLDVNYIKDNFSKQYVSPAKHYTPNKEQNVGNRVQQIVNELKNAPDDQNKRKQLLNKYDNELNFLSDSAKNHYINGKPLPITNKFKQKLTNNVVSSEDTKAEARKIFKELSDNKELNDTNTTPERKAKIINKRKEILKQYPQVLEAMGNPNNIEDYINGNIPFPPSLKIELSKKLAQAQSKNTSDNKSNKNTYNNLVKKIAHDKNYINKVLSEVENAKTNTEKMKLAENYPEIKESVQKSIRENKPINIEEAKKELLNSTTGTENHKLKLDSPEVEAFDYVDDSNFINNKYKNYTKPQLIKALQQCQENCRILKDQQQIQNGQISNLDIDSSTNILDTKLPNLDSSNVELLLQNPLKNSSTQVENLNRNIKKSNTQAGEYINEPEINEKLLSNINKSNKNTYNDWINKVAKGGYVDINNSNNSYNDWVKDVVGSKNYTDNLLKGNKEYKKPSIKEKQEPYYPTGKELNKMFNSAEEVTGDDLNRLFAENQINNNETAIVPYKQPLSEQFSNIQQTKPVNQTQLSSSQGIPQVERPQLTMSQEIPQMKTISQDQNTQPLSKSQIISRTESLPQVNEQQNLTSSQVMPQTANPVLQKLNPQKRDNGYNTLVNNVKTGLKADSSILESNSQKQIDPKKQDIQFNEEQVFDSNQDALDDMPDEQFGRVITQDEQFNPNIEHSKTQIEQDNSSINPSIERSKTQTKDNVQNTNNIIKESVNSNIDELKESQFKNNNNNLGEGIKASTYSSDDIDNITELKKSQLKNDNNNLGEGIKASTYSSDDIDNITELKESQLKNDNNNLGEGIKASTYSDDGIDNITELKESQLKNDNNNLGEGIKASTYSGDDIDNIAGLKESQLKNDNNNLGEGIKASTYSDDDIDDIAELKKSQFKNSENLGSYKTNYIVDGFEEPENDKDVEEFFTSNPIKKSNTQVKPSTNLMGDNIRRTNTIPGKIQTNYDNEEENSMYGSLDDSIMGRGDNQGNQFLDNDNKGSKQSGELGESQNILDSQNEFDDFKGSINVDEFNNIKQSKIDESINIDDVIEKDNKIGIDINTGEDIDKKIEDGTKMPTKNFINQENMNENFDNFFDDDIDLDLFEDEDINKNDKSQNKKEIKESVNFDDELENENKEESISEGKNIGNNTSKVSNEEDDYLDLLDEFDDFENDKEENIKSDTNDLDFSDEQKAEIKDIEKFVKAANNMN